MKKLHYLLPLLIFFGIRTCMAQYTDLLDFNGTNGANPEGSVTVSGSRIYGMTYAGGAHNFGCVFSVDTDGTGYKDLLDFNDTNGAYPNYGSLVLSGKVLYGMTSYGGSQNMGCVFSVDTDGSNYTDLLDFTGTNGGRPHGSLILIGKILYGMTYAGGAHNFGCVFSVDAGGGGYRDLYDFDGTGGQNPDGDLTLSGSTFYGMTEFGGLNGCGCIFSVDTSGTGYKDLLDFNDYLAPYGESPYGSITVSAGKLYGMVYAGTPPDGGAVFSIDVDGSNYKDLVEFGGTNGQNPYGNLMLVGNMLYGMTSDGTGTVKGGCIFSVDTGGVSFNDLFNFSTTGFSVPQGSLTLAGDKFYGMTTMGGTGGKGVVFGVSRTVGINELNRNTEGVRLFPDPNNGRFTVIDSGYKLTANSCMDIYNALGEKIYSALFTNSHSSFTVNISSQPSGIYFYRITGGSDAQIASGKFFVQ